MNILIVLNGWLTKISGGDYHILRVAQFWNKNNKIYCLLPRLGYENAKSSGLLVGQSIIIETPFEKEIDNLFTVIILYLFRIFKTIFLRYNDKFDVVIASSHFLYDVIPATIISKRHKAKMIVYVHHIVLSSRRTSSISDVISKLNELISLQIIKHFADLVFVVSPNVKKYLVGRGFKQNKIHITSNGIEIKYIDTINSKYTRYDCCFCGRIVAQKGVFDLVDIWKKVIEVIPNAKLAIIGDGPDLSTLSKRIRENKLDKNIILLGFLSEDEKIKIMKSSKIFILPSYEEGWGIVIGEALACGLPVICYDIPEIKPIWKDNVIWVPKGNKEEFAQRVVELLKDKHLREVFGIRGVKFVKQYDWEEIAKKEIMLINTLGG